MFIIVKLIQSQIDVSCVWANWRRGSFVPLFQTQEHTCLKILLMWFKQGPESREKITRPKSKLTKIKRIITNYNRSHRNWQMSCYIRLYTVDESHAALLGLRELGYSSLALIPKWLSGVSRVHCTACLI